MERFYVIEWKVGWVDSLKDGCFDGCVGWIDGIDEK
jgi:hypothetical protein